MPKTKTLATLDAESFLEGEDVLEADTDAVIEMQAWALGETIHQTAWVETAGSDVEETLLFDVWIPPWATQVTAWVDYLPVDLIDVSFTITVGGDTQALPLTAGGSAGSVTMATSLTGTGLQVVQIVGAKGSSGAAQYEGVHIRSDVVAAANLPNPT